MGDLISREAALVFESQLRDVVDGSDGWNPALSTYASALRALPSATQAGGWMPIDSAPKDGTSIILADWRVGGGHPVVACWDTCLAGLMWLDSEGDTGYHDEFFTHWTPLPPAPEAGE